MHFTFFSDIVIASKLINLGLDVSKKAKEVLGSVRCLKLQNVTECQLFFPRIVEEVDSDVVCVESDEDNGINNVTIGHLCGDFMEDIMDDDNDHLSCDFKIVFQKNKSMSTFNKKKIKIVRKIRISNRSK